MSRAVLLALGVVAGVAAWAAYRRQQVGAVVSQFSSALNDGAQYLGGVVSDTAGRFINVGSMGAVQKSLVDNQNVRAFLRVIRTGEGTADDDGYRRLFGGGLFYSYADHPRVVVRKSGYASTAAGAYQFLAKSWDETRAKMGLTDFTPRSQDIAALGRIAARGALDDVLAGRFDDAIKRVSWEWASLPGSPYGQPTISLAKARAVFVASGGDISGNLA